MVDPNTGEGQKSTTRRSCLREQSSDGVTDSKERRSVSFNLRTEVHKFVERPESDKNASSQVTEDQATHSKENRSNLDGIASPLRSEGYDDDLQMDEVSNTPLLPPINISSRKSTLNNISNTPDITTEPPKILNSPPSRLILSSPPKKDQTYAKCQQGANSEMPRNEEQKAQTQAPTNLGDLLKASDFGDYGKYRSQSEGPKSPSPPSPRDNLLNLLEDTAPLPKDDTKKTKTDDRRPSTRSPGEAYRSPLLRKSAVNIGQRNQTLHNASSTLQMFNKSTTSRDRIKEQMRSVRDNVASAEATPPPLSQLLNTSTDTQGENRVSSPVSLPPTEPQPSPALESSTAPIPSGTLDLNIGSQLSVITSSDRFQPMMSSPSVEQQSKQPIFKSPLQLSGALRRNRQDWDQESAIGSVHEEEDIFASYKEVIRSPGQAYRGGASRGSLDFDPDDFQDWLSRKGRDKNNVIQSNDEFDQENLSFDNFDKDVVEAPWRQIYGPGNPVGWIEFAQDARINQRVYQPTLKKGVTTNEDHDEPMTETSMSTESALLGTSSDQVPKEFWTMHRDQLRRKLDPDNIFHSDEITDYYPFVKLPQNYQNEKIEIRDLIPFTQNEVEQFVRQFSHFHAMIKTFEIFAKRMVEDVDYVVRVTSDPKLWEEEIAGSSHLIDLFNKTNETLVLTEGNEVYGMDEVHPIGRRDENLRNWTVNEAAKETYPPTAHNISNNCLLQAIIDDGYEADLVLIEVREYVHSLWKGVKEVSDARVKNSLVLEVAYLIHEMNWSNMKKLSEFAIMRKERSSQQSVLIKKSRQLQNEYATHVKSIKDKYQNIEELETLKRANISDSKSRLSAHMKNLSDQVSNLQSLIREASEAESSARSHALCVGNLLSDTLPEVLESRALFELSASFTRINNVSQSGSSSIDWHSGWMIEQSHLQSPSETMGLFTSESARFLCEHGEEFLESIEQPCVIGDAAEKSSDSKWMDIYQDSCQTVQDGGGDISCLVKYIDELSTSLRSMKKSKRFHEFYKKKNHQVMQTLRAMDKERLQIATERKLKALSTQNIWPNYHFGNRSVHSTVYCQIYREWYINSDDCMHYEDPKLSHGTYEGARVVLWNSCRHPMRWRSRDRSIAPTICQSMWQPALLCEKRLSMADSEFTSRLFYLVEAIGNATARDWWTTALEGTGPFPSKASSHSSNRNRNSISLFEQELAKDVNRYLYLASWLIRDFRSTITNENVGVIRYFAGPVLPFEFPKHDHFMISFRLIHLGIRKRYDDRFESLKQILSLGQFSLSLKTNIAESLGTGGRLLFGLQDAIVHFLPWDATSAIDAETLADIQSIEDDLRDVFLVYFHENLFSKETERRSEAHFGPARIPKSIKMVACRTDEYLITRFCERAIKHILDEPKPVDHTPQLV